MRPTLPRTVVIGSVFPYGKRAGREAHLLLVPRLGIRGGVCLGGVCAYQCGLNMLM